MAGIVGDRGQAQRIRRAVQQPFEGGSPLRERAIRQIVGAEHDHVEGNQRGRRQEAQALHPRGRGMRPLKQRGEVAFDDNLAIENETLCRQLPEALMISGK